MLTLTGSLLAAKYRVGVRLGGGGMGEVYEGIQEDLGRRVAIKVMSGPVASDPILLERFQREARAVAALGHPHIVSVTDFQDNPGEPPFLVMERLVGESFGDALERERFLDPTRVARLGEQTLSALAAAHEAGLVHRDVKPDNIFLCKTDTGADLVKLLDFGVAKVLEEEARGKLTNTGAVVGTLAYMAPEQARGERVDLRADIYGVGACMYHALAGRPPFDAPTAARLFSSVVNDSPPPLGTIRPDLDGALIGIVDRAMARDPMHRYPSARAMMSAIGALLRGEPLPTDPMSAYSQAPTSPIVASPRVASGPVRVHGVAYELARTGAAAPFPGPAGPGYTVHPSAPPPNVHPGSGGGMMVAPYAIPSVAPQERSSFMVTFAAMALLVIAAGIGVGAYIVHNRTSQSVAAVTTQPTTPPSAMLVAEANPMETPTSLATLSPANTTTAHVSTGGTAFTPPPITTIPSNASLGQLIQAMMSAHQAKDGKGCLDAYDKLKQNPDFSDPSNSYAFIHSQCLMYAGRCDEGRREMTGYFSQLKTTPMAPENIAAAVGAQAQLSCPVNQLTAGERAQRAYAALASASNAKDPSKELRSADELAAEIPHLPQSTEEERRKLISYEYMTARGYADGGRCDAARRHFKSECALTNASISPDQCATNLMASTACRGQP